ncbi:LysR family transcriptional regulator [Sandaracinobacteroides saxicola]|uniref:LysR family transcriptional regulator n=1 Tax=Sandaracinobacteroides saxicola TaxID=2759707 RepID=A0A7G5IFX5_9SPHN|nr:LysR family transcriptional regulator [Sandaracinobacteroides saxicola]QMW22267.1 LysR family transcriptional regulator [Sandaracinobacteroides saxicola]
MKRTLLPLNALRVFDAAARHLSFTKAADDLAVTPAAVGQQIRALEELLGVILFRRTTRGLELTPEAESALPSLREGFNLFEETVRTLQAGQGSLVLTMACTRSARFWLLPRLARWLDGQEGLSVRLSLVDGMVDFTQANLDLALIYGPPPDAEGVHGRKIAEEELVTVAAPGLAAPLPIGSPEAAWTQEEGSPRLIVDHAGAALDAALAGLGMARVPRTLAASALADGLLAERGAAMPTSDDFWLCAPAPQWRQPKVRALVGWLLAEGG